MYVIKPKADLKCTPGAWCHTQSDALQLHTHLRCDDIPSLSACIKKLADYRRDFFGTPGGNPRLLRAYPLKVHHSTFTLLRKALALQAAPYSIPAARTQKRQSLRLPFWYSRRESNPQLPLRRGLLYPFNYGSLIIVREIPSRSSS